MLEQKEQRRRRRSKEREEDGTSSVNNLSKSAFNTRTYDTLATYDIYEGHQPLPYHESRASAARSGWWWQNGPISGGGVDSDARKGKWNYKDDTIIITIMAFE